MQLSNILYPSAQPASRKAPSSLAIKKEHFGQNPKTSESHSKLSIGTTMLFIATSLIPNWFNTHVFAQEKTPSSQHLTLPIPKSQNTPKDGETVFYTYEKEQYPHVLSVLKAKLAQGEPISLKLTEKHIEFTGSLFDTSPASMLLEEGIRLEKSLISNKEEKEIINTYFSHTEELRPDLAIETDEKAFLKQLNTAPKESTLTYIPLPFAYFELKIPRTAASSLVFVLHNTMPLYTIVKTAQEQKIPLIIKKLTPAEKPERYPELQRDAIEAELPELDEAPESPSLPTTAQQPDKPIVEAPPQNTLPKLPSPYQRTESVETQLMFKLYEEKHYPRVLKFLEAAFQQNVPIVIKQMTKDFIDLLIESEAFPLESSAGIKLKGAGIRLETKFLTPEQIEKHILAPYYQSADQNKLCEPEIPVDELTFLKQMKALPQGQIQALTHQTYIFPLPLHKPEKRHLYFLVTQPSNQQEFRFRLDTQHPSKALSALAKKLNIPIQKPSFRKPTARDYERMYQKVQDLGIH